jgi:hypothetical protein
MKKSIKKIQKHKKIIKRSRSNKTRRYSKKYKGGQGDDDEPVKKRARYNKPRITFMNTPIIRFMSMAMDIRNNGPIVSPLSGPDAVYELMKKILNLWNYAIQNIDNPEELKIVRETIDKLYNEVVTAFPQEHVGEEEPQMEIADYKSNAILEELFHYVANISRDETFKEVIKIPDIDYFNAPNRDNPNIVYPPPPENNIMDEE